MAEKLLLISTFHFPPSAASGTQRVLGLVRHLPRFGWSCAVLAPPGLPWEPRDERLLAEVPEATIVRRVPYFTGKAGAPVRIYAPFLSWVVRALPAGLSLARRIRPAAVLTTGPPHQIHLHGLALKRALGIPWVADFRDPWVSCARTPPTGRLVPRVDAAIEARVFRRADLILANTPNATDALRQAFPGSRDRIVTVTNGYDPERFEGLRRRPPPGPDAPLRILHPGQIYSGREPGPFLEGLKRVLASRGATDRPIRLEFVGHLEADDADVRLRSLVEGLGLESVTSIEGHVPYVESLRRMAEADILLLLDSPGRKVGVPAKLYEFVGAGRPILALAEDRSDAAWVLESTGLASRVVHPSDPDAIARGLGELVGVAESGRAAPDPAPDPTATPFARREIAGRLAERLDRIALGTGLAAG